MLTPLKTLSLGQKGYAKEAGRACIDYAFKALGSKMLYNIDNAI